MDASRLLSDGTPVALADGTTVTVRFDFEAMLRLETDYGSTFEFAKALDSRQRGQGYKAILDGLRAAVRGRDVTASDLDPRDFIAYRDALVAAWVQAMPELADTADEGKATGEGSTGPTSTTSGPSSSDAPMRRGAA